VAAGIGVIYLWRYRQLRLAVEDGRLRFRLDGSAKAA